jgi:hypothetical protein
MIPAVLSRSPEAAAAAEEHSDYFSTEAHYLSLANRIVAALRTPGGFILVTGDPPTVPHLLSQALRKSTQSRYTVIDVACHAELRSEELSRARSAIAALPPSGAPPAASQSAVSASSIFVFADADRLSDDRIREIVEFTERASQRNIAALLLARSGFVSRLEGESLQFLKERLVARFEFQEVGQDEGIEFLRHQLAARHAGSDAHGMLPGVRQALAAAGVLLVAGIGAFLFFFEGHHLPDGPVVRSSPPEATAPQSLGNEGPISASSPSNPDLPATPAQPQPAPLTQETSPRDALAPMGMQATSSAELPSTPLPPANQQALSIEVAALVSRGDGFLRAGDITSARLFYERAADAGSAAAALRLGATFDPGFLTRTGIHGISGDAAQAASWYRRARDLGDAAAADWLEGLERQRAVEPGSSRR